MANDPRHTQPGATRRFSHAVLLGGLAPFVLSGCGLSEWAKNGAKVGPNYTPPPAPIEDHWIDYQDARVKTDPHDLRRWWTVFNDPVLNSLVDQAYQQNLSLRTAGERIVEARAQRNIVVGNIFPQVQQATGSYSANKASNESAGGFNNDQWFQNSNVGFSASWELDLWGRFRRSIEAADAGLEASVADYDDVLVVLLADVSANYIQYRTFQERLAVAHRNIEIQEKSFQLAQDKFQAGASTERDAQQSKQVLEQTRASIPQLEASARQANNALCVLLGIPPRDLADRLGTVDRIPTAEPELALGIPADLLRRRPDVRRIERQAAAQSALIGVAKADLYPRFSINGNIGLSAQHFENMFQSPGSLTGSVGPSFQWDILNYGRVENNVEAQEARFRQFVLGYQNAVLRASREAEDAVVGFLKSQERVRALGRSVAAADRTVQITHDQYREGVIDFTPVFLFEGTLAQQQDELAIAQGQIALSLIDLYRALGGGWEIRLGHGGGPTTQPAATQPVATAR
jgi:NodT family efflux transporter outer membrane factor (OMF) lipoprotein